MPVDETSRVKGHVYVTLFADLERKRVLTVAEGKDHKTIETFQWAGGSRKQLFEDRIGDDESPGKRSSRPG